jgi:glycosyl hydrolase family 28
MKHLWPTRAIRVPLTSPVNACLSLPRYLVWLVLVCLMFCFAIQAQARDAKLTLSITDHGAVGDGNTLNTEAIQRAIDTCTKRGGGIVRVPQGRFVTGTILLKDNVTLYLDEGAILLGSLNPADYRNVDPFKDGLGAEVGFAMVAAVDAKNIGIVGHGAINGRGKEIAEGMPFKGEGWGSRPFLLRFVRSRNISLRDIQLLYAAAWTCNFFQARNVTIERLKIESYGVPHNDGINIDSSQGFRIKDCDVDSGDDALVFKTTSSMPIRDILVTGCRLKSRQGAIKFGTESVANFENVRISNCQIRDTRNGGIKLLSVDGAHLQNIRITDITMVNVATPIFVRLGARLKTFRPGEKQGQVGEIRNVLIKNVRAVAAGQAQIMPPSGIFITGIPGHQVGTLLLENIEIELAGGGTREQGRQLLEEKIDVYPEINRFGPRLPAFGVYARHVNGLTIKGLTLKLGAPDHRPALVCQDCENAEFVEWKLPASAESESLVRLESSRRILLKGFELIGMTSTFARIEGNDSGAIRLMNNKLGGTRKSVELGENVNAGTIVDQSKF